MAEEESLVPSLKTMSFSTYQGRSSCWEDLSPELMELVLQRLTLVDYLKCREICSSWREVVDASKGRCPPKPQFPFLLTVPPDHDATAKLLGLTQQKAFHMSIQSWEGLMCVVQSVHGWLMFSTFFNNPKKDCCSIAFSFYNPVSRARFNLPDLSLFPGKWGKQPFIRNEFASVPYSPEFLVALLIADWQKQRLAFFKVGHNSWTSIETIETRTYTFQDIAVNDDKLYAIAQDTVDFMFIFSLKDPNTITAKQLVMLDPKPILTRSHFHINCGVRHDTDYVMSRLTVDNTSGELLLVFHVSQRAWMMDCKKYSYWTKGFRVFRLDLSGPRWIEIKHLTDRFLFYDRTRIRIISASGFDGAQEFKGGNCIFFCLANTFHVDQFLNHDVGVFFLTCKSIRRYSFYSAAPAAIQDIWFSPNLW